MVARDEVAFLFWGDQPDEIARKNLREAISRLRSALANPDWVLTEPDLVGLDFNYIQTDLHEFNTLIDPILGYCNSTPIDQPLPQPIYQTITKAIALWRSPKCMAGTILTGSAELEHWYLNETRQKEQVYLNLLERASFHALISTNFEECLYFARQGLSADPYHESFHYVILRAFLSMGRQAPAREHLRTHIQQLLNDGYVLTESRLIELIQYIQEAKPVRTNRIVKPRLNSHVTLKAPFIGRQVYLDQLWNRFFRGGGVLILGETGQGKTRLMEQFISQAVPAARLLTANCHASENQLDLQPLIELIRDHFEERDWMAIPALWAAQLVRIFPEIIELRPELRQVYGETIFEKNSPTIQSNLFEALRQAFWAVAQQEKLLICIEGIQWADESSLAALTYILERPPFTDQSIVVLTARTGDWHSKIEHLEQYLRRSPNGMVLEMNGLNIDETRTLLDHILPGRPAELFIQKIHADSGGNPLYILELVRTALEHGIDPINDPIESIPVPNKIIHLIQQRLEDISYPERNLLEIAAIYGTEFDPAVVQAASEYPLDQFAIYLDQLNERRLIEPLSQPSSEHHYRFIHSKFREVILEEIPDLRRRWLHRKVANALSTHSSHSYNHPAILAEHFEKSHDPSVAFQFWVLAAQHARRTHAVAKALDYFSRAEQQLKLATDLTTRQIYDFYFDWSKMAFDVDRLDLMQHISQALLQHGYERKSDLLIGAAHSVQSDAYTYEKKFGAALESNRQAEKFLERTGHAQAITKMYIRRGECLLFLNHFAEADQAFRAALEQRGDESDTRYLRAVANVHGQLAMLTLYSGWPAISLKHAQDAHKYFEAVRDPYGKVIAFSALARAYYYLGNYQTARQYCEAGLESAEKLQAWRYLGILHSFTARIELATGYIDESLKNIRSLFQIGDNHNHPEMIAVGNYLTGNIFSWLLDHSQAFEYYQASYAINQNPFLTNTILFRKGFSQSLANDFKAGMEILEQVTQTTTKQNMHLETLQSRLYTALARFEKKQYENLYQMATEISEQAKQRELKTIQLIAEMLTTILKLRSNEAKAEYLAIENLLEDSRTMSNPLLELIFVLQLCRFNRSLGSNFPIDNSRINRLLHQLEENARDPLIESAFKNFRNMLKICETPA